MSCREGDGLPCLFTALGGNPLALALIRYLSTVEKEAFPYIVML